MAGGVDAQPALDCRPVRAGPDPGRVRAAAEHQVEPGHDHGLARAGLPVTTVNPGDSSRTASSITPRAVMWTSSSMGARLLFPVRPFPAPLGTSLLRNLLLHTAVAGAALVVPAWPAPAPASDRQAELGDQPVGERGTSRRAA